MLFSVPTYRISASYKSAHFSVGGDQSSMNDLDLHKDHVPIT